MLPPNLPIYHTDLFLPQYRPLERGDWRLRIVPMNLCRGYWSPARLVVDMAALICNDDTWMSTAPLELESQEIGIRLARGHVLIGGLGLGWSAANCALSEDVDRVTVVELD